ncbi:MAG: cysteine desulfurase [Chloroflexi bacterium]|nr:cysteine desulfurase [Chloroflexota bacterium]
MFDPKDIRKDFPILSRTVHGKPLVYLDNAATSQKPRQVIQTLVDCYELYNANVHRGVHTISVEATERMEEARRKVSRFINAPSTEGVIFVRNTTEAVNLVANSWAMDNVGQGDEIVVSEVEHHSNLVPWQKVAHQKGATLKLLPATEDGRVDLSFLESIITQHTKLVSVVHISNMTGAINPVKEIGRRAHQVGALFMVDGAQSVPHMPIDVCNLDCDFLAFSGHKMLAPPGIGVLFGKVSILEKMEPFLRGGEMVREVWYDHATWNDLPNKFEAGTPNFTDAVALGAAVDYLDGLGMDAVRQHEIDITTYALKAFAELEELDVIGPKEAQDRGGLVTFTAGDIHPHDLGTFLDSEGVAIRTGHHCVMPYHRKLGLVATGRASFYVYNTNEEIDTLIQALKKALAYFAHAS